MPIVGGGSIIPGDGGIAPTVDDTRSGGGGGVSPITFDVNPTYGDPFTLESSESSFEVQLINSNQTIAAGVELSFSNTSLQALTTPDFGSADAPSFVLDPGATRQIVIERGPGAPAPGSATPINCTISYTLSNGQTTAYTNDIVVEAVPASMHNSIISLLASNYGAGTLPTLEYRFFNSQNSGSAGSTYDLNKQNSVTFNQNSTAYTGFEGYCQVTDRYSRAVTNSGLSSTPYDISVSNTTAIIAVSPYAYYSGTGESHMSGQSNQPFSLDMVTNNGNNPATAPYVSVTASTGSVTTSLGTGYSNTVQSNSEQIAFRKIDGNGNNVANDNPFLMAVTNTGTGLIVRWKQKGHGSGFSYRNVGAPGTLSATTHALLVVGDDYIYTRSARSLRYLYWAFIPHALTDAEFEQLTLVADM